MKKLMLTAATVLMTSHGVFAATDYSKCMDYVGMTIDPYSSSLSMGAFRLTDKGEVIPSKSASLKNKSIKDKDGKIIGKQSIVTIERDSLMGGYPTMGGGVPPKQKQVFTISYDENGQLTQISSKFPYDAVKIKEQMKIAQEQYQQSLNAATPPKNGEAPKGAEVTNPATDNVENNYTPPFPMIDDNITEFQVRNGKCFVAKEKMVTRNLNDDDAKTNLSTSTRFDTKLCRNISDFLKKNPEARACFDPAINDQMEELFSEYKKANLKELDWGLGSYMTGYPGLGIGGYSGGGFGGMGGGGLAEHFASIDESTKPEEGKKSKEDERFDKEMKEMKLKSRKMMGISPVITGHKILSNCEFSGLQTTIDDDSLWATGEVDCPGCTKTNTGKPK